MINKMENTAVTTSNSNELYAQYDWYQSTFPPVIQKSCDEFFLEGFKFDLIGVSKNINMLLDKDFYFVTKIRIDRQHDMFFRTSENAVSIMLDRILGKVNRRFNLNKMTDLEARILTSFNDYMFEAAKQFLNPPPANEIKRTNFDIIHLTFIMKDLDDEEGKAGKFIVSLPEVLLNPVSVEPGEMKFDYDDFRKSSLDVRIKVGTTKFSVFDLKNLDADDIVVFDNSSLKKMELQYNDYEKEINLNPNLGLIMPIDNNGGEDMGANPNLWDTIEVEMSAEFDSVKITLGDLKNIEEGMVVDLTSIYDNKVTLRVEDKTIARGELVIVNDRYGVKIEEVTAKGKKASVSSDNETGAEGFEPSDDEDEIPEMPEVESQSGPVDEEEEFDYSDFELDDEDI